MNSSEQVIGLAGLGAGLILIYAVYKNESPIALFKTSLGNATPTTAISTSSVSALTPGSDIGDVDNSDAVTAATGVEQSTDQGRAGGLKAKTIQPDLVSIGSQPRFKLDRIAAASYARVEATYGKMIPITGSYRSFTEQAAGYALDPSRFAAPGHSLHEVGLAVDVNTDKVNPNDPSLVAAFSSNGWFRRGKIQKDGLPEPWHWSYGVPG